MKKQAVTKFLDSKNWKISEEEYDDLSEYMGDYEVRQGEKPNASEIMKWIDDLSKMEERDGDDYFYSEYLRDPKNADDIFAELITRNLIDEHSLE